MRLIKARVANYRSVNDTGWFDLEPKKSILVGPNEAGKTAVLRALQHINPPAGTPPLDVLRDYPRSRYNDITKKIVDPKKVIVSQAQFQLEPDDQAEIAEEFRGCTYTVTRMLDNSVTHTLNGAPPHITYSTLKKDLARLASHVDSRETIPADPAQAPPKASSGIAKVIEQWNDDTLVREDKAKALSTALDTVYAKIEEGNAAEEERFDKLKSAIGLHDRYKAALESLHKRLPVFVLFSNYFRVKPLLHLEHLAQRVEQKLLDDDQYDYGNLCLLKLLGFTARELSNLGKTAEPQAKDAAALKAYRDQLDTRSYQLNAASVKLTNEIRSIWNPDPTKDEADRLRITADGQYLKVVVEDDLGVEIELDQRSEGFQWLVSFFVVFFAEAADKHKNAILLLDEPGMSLHGLKQREFRGTISRLSDTNQTIYSTHSPFLVGPDELDLVRVVEMKDRTTGTKVHTVVSADDPAALLPLQEALGYDLAQSLFAQQRNLVLEGLTDFWYVEATAALMAAANLAVLNEKISPVSANSAGKVVYYATILHAHHLKVAALLDSDAAGDQAAQQDSLVAALGHKGIIRTKDAYSGEVKRPEIEDLLRETLVAVAKKDLAIDVAATAQKQPARPILDIFKEANPNFSKYKLAKAFVRWTREHQAEDLTDAERKDWTALIKTINAALK